MVGLVTMGLGTLLLVVGGLWMVVNAFKVSVLWGLGVLLLAPVSLVFLVKYWKENKTAFFVQLAGIAMVIVSVVLAQPTAAH